MQQVPVSAANPSAAVALEGLPVGITAAGILSSCNPVKGSYQLIWKGVAQGSWLTTLPNAAHMSVSWGWDGVGVSIAVWSDAVHVFRWQFG
jgi:hypothetical protein